ncbi:alanyl-tRNA editing protein [Granulicella sibirica]|uniref:Alanine--tRNA ligase n=1 Tax=Granulicella sibirica TaxID=2479048 RepID=A0A4Q0T2D1_9BACT|nr:alanine--tRNA ligase-related protein [Granulicella sibirica]RXH56069.1 Alanyl-tRNA synthetase family protein [Granulicella sibirica]
MSVAERLYYDAQELMDFGAVVTDIRLESRVDGKNRWQVALDRTAFYPESGGQPWDLGTIEAVARSGARLEVPVLAVVEDAGEVWHVVEKPLTAGTEVTGRVDAGRRLDHMQQHTGQHLLSAVFLRELGAATVSFHLGADSSTIDLAVGALDWENAVGVEEAANRLIAENRGVSVEVVERGLAETMLERGELRKLPEREGTIRIVAIEGVEWNACGGTHVASTGRIGGLTVRRIERMKQAVRVEFCCGLRAVRAARQDFERIGEIGRLLSSGPGELAGKISVMLDDARSTAKQSRTLLEEIAGFEARTLAGRLVEATSRDAEYAKLLAAKVVALDGRRVAIIRTSNGERGTIVLAAGGDAGVNCGAVLKDSLAVLGARGGGSAGMAQGGVAAGDMDRLLEEIRVRISI